MNAPDALRLPPHSVEAEQSLIGGLLLSNSAWDRIADQISDADFFRNDHRIIFRHIRLLLESGKPADVVTVFESIEKSAEVEACGGLAYLGEIANNTPSAANIRRYAEIVRERAMLRKLQQIGETLAAACAKPGAHSATEIAAAAQSEMEHAMDREVDDGVSKRDAIAAALTDVEARRQTGATSGLLVGLRDFDRLTNGLEPGQVVVVAARPSAGKSALVIQFSDFVSKRGAPVALFSLEMGAREIAQRLVAQNSGVSVHQMRSGTNDQDSWRLMSNELIQSNDLLRIYDRRAITVAFVRAKARQHARRHGGKLGLIAIDYLGLMTAAGGDNRTQQLGDLSRSLKALAGEFGAPIIVAAQLNRGVEGRVDKRPLLSDLRDSGEVEQDADVVCMLHRESLYSAAPEWAGVAELIVRTNRNGPTGEVLLSYEPERMRFTDYTGPNPRRLAGSAKTTRRGFDE